MRINKFLIAGLLLAAFPVALQAEDYTFTTNSDNTITITKFIGTGGTASVPGTIDGRPVTAIGSNAFSYLEPASVRIPNSVTNIEESAFDLCTELASITVDATNSFYSSMDGVLFDKSRTVLIRYPEGKLDAYIIPGSVTSIGNHALFNCYGLSGVTIPDSVTSIGDYAFADCTRLTDIMLPDSVTNIGKSAFYLCTGLTTITVNATNAFYSSIDSVLFDKSQTVLIQCSVGKGGDYTIPDNVKSVGDYAFADCTGLTSVIIPESVTNIGKSAFYLCTGLTAITVHSTNAFYSSIDGVLFDKSRTILIQYPAGKSGTYAIPDSVKSIGDSAFFNCYSLPSITIPGSVTNIGNSAFSYCGLTGITIPKSITAIGDYAFSDCTDLAGIHFWGKAPGLGSSVFKNDNRATVYYPAGTAGWSATFGERPATSISLLTINGGAGGGSYTNNQRVKITAKAPAAGDIFTRWSGATQYVASVTSTTTTVTMPARAVTITATYEPRNVIILQ